MTSAPVSIAGGKNSNHPKKNLKTKKIPHQPAERRSKWSVQWGAQWISCSETPEDSSSMNTLERWHTDKQPENNTPSTHLTFTPPFWRRLRQNVDMFERLSSQVQGWRSTYTYKLLDVAIIWKAATVLSVLSAKLWGHVYTDVKSKGKVWKQATESRK